MVYGQGLIDWMILVKEDKNEHHSAFIAAACAKPLASVTYTAHCNQLSAALVKQRRSYLLALHLDVIRMLQLR